MTPSPARARGGSSFEEKALLPVPEFVDSLVPIEFIPHTEPPARPHSADEALIFTIHDGPQVPRHLFGGRAEEMFSRPAVAEAYVRERDWGADRVARHLSREIGTGGYMSLRMARAVMDFGRFPGTSNVGETYLRRHAIYPPVQDFLDAGEAHSLLEDYYDPASMAFVSFLSGKRVSISVHTYDRFNKSGTERPEVSLVSRSLSYQRTSTIPPYIFDPLFPPILGEATCHRILTYQALVNLERGGWRTALNYPYVMPEGSVEIRAQVWFFFRHLRRNFLAAFPDTENDPAYERVWRMLTDVVRRDSGAERLRAHLHRHRRPEPEEEALFARCREAYGRIERFLSAHRGSLVESFRFAHERLSCLGIEVRKDLLARLDDRGLPVAPRPDAEAVAAQIAGLIGSAVRSYFEEVATEGEAETPEERRVLAVG